MPSEFSKFAWLKAVEWFDLTATEHKVLDHICNKADGATGEKAYVTDPGMAQAVSRSEKSIQRATKRLRDLGLIERTQRGIKGSRPSTYRLTIPTKPETEVTGHRGNNRTSITGHSDRVTGHSCPHNPTPVSGISDPVTRSSLRGSGSKEPDLPDMAMSGVRQPDTEVSEGTKENIFPVDPFLVGGLPGICLPDKEDIFDVLPAEDESKGEQMLEAGFGPIDFDPWPEPETAPKLSSVPGPDSNPFDCEPAWYTRAKQQQPVGIDSSFFDSEPNTHVPETPWPDEAGVVPTQESSICTTCKYPLRPSTGCAHPSHKTRSMS